MASEPVDCQIVVGLALLLEGHNLILILGLVHFRCEQLVVVLLVHLLFLGLDVLVLLDVAVDLLELLQPLLDRLVQLHRVLGRVLERLLQVGDLAGKLALRRLVLGILLLDLWQVLELNGLPLEDGALHVLAHLLLLLERNWA